MVTDTISDLLTKIRNANNVRHHIVQVPLTKMTISLVKILKEEGFIEDYKILKNKSQSSLILSLKYSGQNRKPVITQLERVSKSGLRQYTNRKNIPNILNHLGIAIISTSNGIMTDRQAKNLKVGGEILCIIS